MLHLWLKGFKNFTFGITNFRQIFFPLNLATNSRHQIFSPPNQNTNHFTVKFLYNFVKNKNWLQGRLVYLNKAPTLVPLNSPFSVLCRQEVNLKMTEPIFKYNNPVVSHFDTSTDRPPRRVPNQIAPTFPPPPGPKITTEQQQYRDSKTISLVTEHLSFLIKNPRVLTKEQETFMFEIASSFVEALNWKLLFHWIWKMWKHVPMHVLSCC